MRLSELGDKEIINLNNGERLGLLADADIIFDEHSGEIMSIVVPERRISFRLLGIEDSGMEVPWSSIRKIGYDMIIVELNH
ncbi:MAG TPA: YlmC/YmxH family sporulation protein [Tissierellaceae bacterium]|nr:YlmC/YmxH family sporulation protein [Tissierellaceae bacterium]